MNQSILRLVNLSLRALLLIGKFGFVFVIARLLPAEDLGLYGLFSAAVVFCLYIVGLDFYSFGSREVIKANTKTKSLLITQQFKIFLLSYFVFVIPFLGIFFFELLSWEWLPYFYALLLVEHLSQELIRLLIAVSQPIAASMVLFVRSGSWVYLVVALFYYDPTFRNLSTIFCLWLSASFCSLMLGMLLVKNTNWRHVFSIALDWGWFKRGLYTCLPFLLGTLALRGVTTVDRYVLESIGGLSMVGVYVIYIGLCNATQSFLDATIFTFTYPKLIESLNMGNYTKFIHQMKIFTLQTVVALAFCVLAIVLLSKPLFEFIGNRLYIEQINNLWILLTATSVFSLSYVPHFGLYAMQKDRWIIYSHFCMAISFCLCLLLLDGKGIEVVSLSLCIACFVCLLAKMTAFFLCNKQVAY